MGKWEVWEEQEVLAYRQDPQVLALHLGLEPQLWDCSEAAGAL